MDERALRDQYVEVNDTRTALCTYARRTRPRSARCSTLTRRCAGAAQMCVGKGHQILRCPWKDIAHAHAKASKQERSGATGSQHKCVRKQRARPCARCLLPLSRALIVVQLSGTRLHF